MSDGASWPWRDFVVKRGTPIRIDLTPTVLPVAKGDPHAFDYAWHFTNHDPGDEDRSER